MKVQIIKAVSPFQKILKERDIVLAAKKTKVESVANFRRLVWSLTLFEPIEN